MEIESFKHAFELGAQALKLIKQVKDLLPHSPQRDAAEKAIEDAEKAFRIAEAKAAQELVYNLCKCTWPPKISLLIKEEAALKGIFNCCVNPVIERRVRIFKPC
jgi:hypothetical protein